MHHRCFIFNALIFFINIDKVMSRDLKKKSVKSKEALYLYTLQTVLLAYRKFWFIFARRMYRKDEEEAHKQIKPNLRTDENEDSKTRYLIETQIFGVFCLSFEISL
jgi:hypothetical protein